MSSNKYLIQALRAYRQVTHGQFDQETYHIVQETQDAADEIERLNACIEEMKKGVTVKFTEGVKPGIGFVNMTSWGRIRDMLAKEDKDGMTPVAIEATERGLQITWAFVKELK